MVDRRCGCGRPARVVVCSAVLCGLLPALMARSALAQDNLLVNSSFEEPRVGPTQDFLTLTPSSAMPGWRITGGSVSISPYWSWQPAESQGRQTLLLAGAAGAASIEQTFPTQPGQEYLFSGWLSHRPDAEAGQAQVSLNGAPFVQLQHSSATAGKTTADEMRWQLFTSRFRATAASTTLTLTDLPTPGGGVVLDGLAVTLTASFPTTGPYFPVDLAGHLTHRLFDPMLTHPGNSLADFDLALPGPTVLRGIPFRVEGAVLVGPGETEGAATMGPVKTVRQVEGIPIGRKVQRLHFLHGTHFGTGNHARIGAYLIHYADGSTVEIPLRDGIEIAEWWTPPAQKARSAPQAWVGQNEAVRRWGRITGYEDSSGIAQGIQLVMLTWPNPYPDREIQSFDMVTGSQPSGNGARAPFLVAVTGE